MAWPSSNPERYCDGVKISCVDGSICITVEARFNKPLYNKVLGITTLFFSQVIDSVMYKEPQHNKPSIQQTNSPVPWHLVNSRFHWVAREGVLHLQYTRYCFVQLL